MHPLRYTCGGALLFLFAILVIWSRADNYSGFFLKQYVQTFDLESLRVPQSHTHPEKSDLVSESFWESDFL